MLPLIEVPDFQGVGPRPAYAARWPGVGKRAIEPISTGDACPETWTDPRQAPQDRRLGQVEKTLLDLLLERPAASQDGGQLASQVNDQLGGGAFPGDRHRLRQRSFVQTPGEVLGSSTCCPFSAAVIWSTPAGCSAGPLGYC